MAVYTPIKGSVIAPCLIAPGLSPKGPDDNRLKDLAKMLARAGYAVYVPYMQDYMNLEIKQTTVSDFFVFLIVFVKTLKIIKML